MDSSDKLRKARVKHICGHLIGSARALSEVATPEDMEDDEIIAGVYAEIGRCECCFTWEEKDELDLFGDCADCTEE